MMLLTSLRDKEECVSEDEDMPVTSIAQTC